MKLVKGTEQNDVALWEQYPSSNKKFKLNSKVKAKCEGNEKCNKKVAREWIKRISYRKRIASENL